MERASNETSVAAMNRRLYGPVPSRRLGRSLGIDLVPFKTCTYDCIYCQLGRTTDLTTARQEYVPVDEILAELGGWLAAGGAADYISLAGSGEPTLHTGIGRLIAGIKGMTRIPVSVITNGSLLWRRDVADSLLAADVVVPSLDAGDQGTFRRVNRPHPDIDFNRMADGLADFTGRYNGKVWLEVMLVGGVNDTPEAMADISRLVERISPTKVQLNTVTRPPAELSATAIEPAVMQGYCGSFPGVAEVIAPSSGMGADKDAAHKTGSEELLAMLARRPCTVEDAAAGLGQNRLLVLKQLDMLVNDGRAEIVPADGKLFYVVNNERR